MTHKAKFVEGEIRDLERFSDLTTDGAKKVIMGLAVDLDDAGTLHSSGDGKTFAEHVSQAIHTSTK